VHAGWWIEKSIRRFFEHLLLFDGRDQNLSRSGEAGARRAPTRGSG
jgi:hypothetical protein